MEEERTDQPTATVKCDSTAGPFKLELIREWSPNGVDRAIDLFEHNFFDHSHFYRVVPGFLVQFGISYSKDNELLKRSRQNIQDDPQLTPPIKFKEGIISYAGSGPHSRSSQMFISYGSNPGLGTQPWETPIGIVTDGMSNVRSFYSEYGDMPPWGNGPVQQKIHNRGASYMDEEFPSMDRFISCVLEEGKGEDDIVKEFNQVDKDLLEGSGDVLQGLKIKGALRDSKKNTLVVNEPGTAYHGFVAIFLGAILSIIVWITIKKHRADKTSKSQ